MSFTIGVSTHPDPWFSRPLIFVPTVISNVQELAEVAASKAISISTFGECKGCKKGDKTEYHGINYRRGAHVAQCQLVGLDVDTGMSIEEANLVMLSMKIQYAILTSKSHQLWKNKGASNESAPCDRFRILIPVDKSTTDSLTITHNLKLFGKKISIDKSCTDAARYFKPSPGIVKVRMVAPLYSWEKPDHAKVAKLAAAKIEQLKCYGKAQIIPPFVKKLLNDGIPEGGRNSACYSIGKALGTAGFSAEKIVQLVERSPLRELGRAEYESAVMNGFNNRIV